MAGISVRVPQEIRKYKERVVFGLTARQIISVILACAICVPLYIWGNRFLPEEMISWIVLLIAVPLIGIGFVKYNGLQMERLAVVIVKYFVCPSKRKSGTDNAFREWDKKAKKEELPKSRKEKKAWAKYKAEASLERSVLMEDAERRGDKDFSVDDAELLTARTPKGGKEKKPKKGSDKDKMKDKKKAGDGYKTPLQIKGEEIEAKQKEDPEYILTPKERKTLSNWNKKKAEMRKAEISREKKNAKKKNSILKKRRTATFTIPKTTADTIPIRATYEEGMFEVTPNKYSKMYRVKDINYKTAKEDEKIIIFCKLGDFLNYFGEEMRFSFCIDNRVVSVEEQERKIFYQMTGDDFDRHRKEYNSVLRRQFLAGRNDIQVEKYVTVTIDANEPLEALLRFHKIDAEVINNLRRIGSDATVVSTTERLAYFHDKFRAGHEGEFRIDFDFLKRQGLSAKDYIAPPGFEFSGSKHFRVGDQYCRCMYLTNLPASISDELLYSLYNVDFPVTINMSYQPVAQDKGLRIVKKQLAGIEMNKIDAEKRAIKSGYNPETIRHDIKDAHAQAEQLYDDMLNKNQKMFFTTILVMVYGDTLDELNENSKVLESKARVATTQLMTLNYQQEEAFKMSLPFGYVSKDLAVDRALTTESAAIFMPFSNLELFQVGGFYYGLNSISNNLVIIDRTDMKTPSGFVLGSSGSGKSFATKREILNVLLHDAESNVIIIDPENEYADFCRAFGGTVLKISPDSTSYINPLDMPENYGLDEDDADDIPLPLKKEKALKKKSDYILSIVERMISVGGGADATTITPVQRTIVDRALRACYKDYLDHDFDMDYLPTLLDFQGYLDEEKKLSEEGRLVAEGVEYYTRGSMDVFAHKTNIDTENRLIVFNVRDLGEQLKQIALIIVFDFIWNRMVENKGKNIRTFCYADEIHVMFKSYYSADYLKQLYKRGRKYGLCVTGMTQNITDLLDSEQARGMIGNSDFIMMLNQTSEDLKVLSNMLNISDEEKAFVHGVDAGCGLLFAEKVIVPFNDKFPSDSYLYKLMSTKFGEDMSDNERAEHIEHIMKTSAS